MSISKKTFPDYKPQSSLQQDLASSIEVMTATCANTLHLPNRQRRPSLFHLLKDGTSFALHAFHNGSAIFVPISRVARPLLHNLSYHLIASKTRDCSIGRIKRWGAEQASKLRTSNIWGVFLTCKRRQLLTQACLTTFCHLLAVSAVVKPSRGGRIFEATLSVSSTFLARFSTREGLGSRCCRSTL